MLARPIRHNDGKIKNSNMSPNLTILKAISTSYK